MKESQPLLQKAETPDYGGYAAISAARAELHGAATVDNNTVIHVQSVESFSDQSEESNNIEKALDYNPALHRSLDHPTSSFDTLVHLLKGNVGTGILAMPDAFKNAGLYVGLFGTLILGTICTHCMHILVNCSNELCRRFQQPSLNFSDVAFYAFESGPICLRRYSTLAQRLVTFFLFVTQMGFCCVYYLFVALNIKQMCDHLFFELDVRVYLLLLLIPTVLLNLLRNLKFLTPVSLMAAIITVGALAITFYYMLDDLPNTDTVKHVGSWSTLPLYFGTAIYAFEGIGVVLPLENNMATPEDFGGATGVLNTGMVIVACLYTAVGFFGYLKYGEAVKGSVTLNLPPDALLSHVVRISMALAIFLSYALQFYVPVKIVEPYVRSKFVENDAKELSATVLRIVMVTLTFLLAACIPNLGSIISLVGAISSSALALIAPPIIEIIVYWNIGYGEYKWRLWKDVLILIFGINGSIFGTYASLVQILHPHID